MIALYLYVSPVNSKCVQQENNTVNFDVYAMALLTSVVLGNK
jgi:hypothetical protein